MQHEIAKHFLLTRSGHSIHLRRAGEGPPVVMLHASPQSARTLEPAVRAAAAAGLTAIAPDLPGYGLSSALPSPVQAVPEMVPWLLELLDALGLGRTTLHGSATGAHLAVATALAEPGRVARLLLDPIGLTAPEEKAMIAQGYLPDVSPHHTGAHLPVIWSMVRDLSLFFPWHVASAATRLAVAPPSAVALHPVLLDYLRAGPGYRDAYGAAFAYGGGARLKDVPVPVGVAVWSGSIVAHHTEALLAAGLPAHVEAVRLGPSAADRHQGVAAWLARHAAEPPAPAQPPETGPDRYLAVPGGRLRARLKLGAGKPALALHARHADGGIAAEDLAEREAWVALDRPGHGESDTLPDETAALTAAWSSLGLEQVVAWGDAAALARSAIPAAAVEAHDAPDDPPPDLTPRWHGAHLLAGWSWLRDRALWSPAASRDPAHAIDRPAELAPTRLHARLVALMKSVRPAP